MKMTSQIPSYHFLKEMKLLIGTSIHLYRGPEPFCFDHMCTWRTICWLFSHTLFFYHLEETKKVIIYTCIHMCLWMCVWVRVRMRVNLNVCVRVSVYVSTSFKKQNLQFTKQYYKCPLLTINKLHICGRISVRYRNCINTQIHSSNINNALPHELHAGHLMWSARPHSAGQGLPSAPDLPRGSPTAPFSGCGTL